MKKVFFCSRNSGVIQIILSPLTITTTTNTCTCNMRTLNSTTHLQLSQDAALSTGLEILQSLRPEVLLLVRFCPIMPHSEPGGGGRSQVSQSERRTPCWTDTQTRAGDGRVMLVSGHVQRQHTHIHQV